MPQITLTAAIILSVGTLLFGFVIAFLFQNGKISAEKKENAFLKAENEKIGNEAEENRKKTGLTQEEFAIRAGLGLSFVRKLEQGKSNLKLNKVNQALYMFGMEAVPGKIEKPSEDL